MNRNDEIKVDEKLRVARIFDSEEVRTVKGKIDFLLKQNENILDTVDVRILVHAYDDIFNQLSMITVYPQIQKEILSLGYDQYKLLSVMINTVDENNYDWMNIAEDYIHNVRSGKYDQLYRDPQMKEKIDELFSKSKSNLLSRSDVKEIEEYTGLLTNSNLFEISSYKDLKSVNIEAQYNELLMGIKKDERSPDMTKTEKMKHAVLLKRLGHGLGTAEEMLYRYADDYEKILDTIDNQNEASIREYLTTKRKLTDNNKINSEIARILKENQAVKQYLTALKTITETNDINQLVKYYNSANKPSPINQSYRMDSIIRKFFCRQKNMELYIPKESDKTRIDSRDVYLIQDDFKISMTSLGAYDTKVDWDVKMLNNHGICSSMIANNNMGCAIIKGAVLGFTDFHERSLYVSSPWDLGSRRFSDNMNISKADVRISRHKFVDIKFHLPDEQINNTRRRHNEDLNERRELDFSKIDVVNEKFKKQPSYAVFFAETGLYDFIDKSKAKGMVLTSENLARCLDMKKLNDVNYRKKLIEKSIQNNDVWKATKEEADNRNVDIVMIDRTYTSIKERLKIDDLERKILSADNKKMQYSQKDFNDFLNMIEKLIVESENNRTANNKTENWHIPNSPLIHKEIREGLFSEDIMKDRLEKIEGKIKTLSPEQQKMCYERLIDVTKKEYDKGQHNLWFERSPGYDLEAKVSEWIVAKNGWKKFDIARLLEEKDTYTGRKGGEIICEAIGDIRELKEYPKSYSRIHGQRHVNNVILFSYLISKNEGKLNSTETDLLIQAAKFHDIGRNGNWNGLGNGKRHDGDKIPHAEPSALGAEYYMKMEKKDNGEPKYSNADIAIVKAAIAYHETHEKNKNNFDDSFFSDLCDRYDVKPQDKDRAKLISIYLKDADAVDRLRFRRENRLDAQNIPEHKKYMRRCNYNLDLGYLRTDSALLLVEPAKALHQDLLKKECQLVYNKDGSYKNKHLKTILVGALKPYEYAIENKKLKYQVHHNVDSIKKFLENKKIEEKNKEINDLMEIYKTVDKSLLGSLRRVFRNIFKRITQKENEIVK